MKFEPNKKYLTISIYTIGTVITIVILTFILFQFRIIGGYLAKTLGLLFELLKPLVFGLIIAYLFEPLVHFYEIRCASGSDFKWPWHSKKVKTKQVRKRSCATALAFITFIAFLGLILLIIVINVKDVIGTLLNQKIGDTLTAYMDSFHEMLLNVDQMIEGMPFINDQFTLISKLNTMLSNVTSTLGDKIMAILSSIGSNLISLGLGIIISFYLLQDKFKLLCIWKRFITLIVPERMRNEVLDIGRDIDYVFSGYIRGQIIDAVIMATLISIALTLIHLDFAIIIGIISGIFNLIPYFGPVVGFILAGFVGFMSDDPQKGLYAILAVIALQQLDGWVIVPKVMGETVKLHPIVVLLVIIIGGQLFGLTGFLLAVPVTGFIRLLIIRYMGDLFSGEESN